MSQLDEANEVIKYRVEERSGYSGTEKEYYDKYLKPKDELFEKFKGFLRAFIAGGYNSKDLFNNTKEIFKDELNGTKGLDEAIEAYTLHQEHRTSRKNVCLVLKTIKRNLEGK